jgi:hypothetical protein
VTSDGPLEFLVTGLEKQPQSPIPRTSS